MVKFEFESQLTGFKKFPFKGVRKKVIKNKRPIMSQVKKVTAEMIDLPEYTLGFLTVIFQKLSFYGMLEGSKPQTNADVPETLLLPIISKKYKYCFEGIDLVQKTMRRRGFSCFLKSYKTEEQDKGGKHYLYNFTISKLNV